MTAADIAQLRLANQHLLSKSLSDIKKIVAHLGAVQAQDFAMAKWAIGSRLDGSTDDLVETAIENGDIFRTHVLRPTWHLVAAEDLRWMLELSVPQVKSILNSMNRKLGIDENVLRHSLSVIEKTLVGHRQRTRDELVFELKNAGLPTDEFRAAHLIMNAELDGLICNGPNRSTQTTYALLDERMAPTPKKTREEALAELASRYFLSHGPATIADFSWWSGLNLTDAKRGFEAVKTSFEEATVDSKIYYFSNKTAIEKTNFQSVFMLAAFDEFMISYRDRTASIDQKFMGHAMTGNGIFKPIIVVDGRVVGVWKRSFKKEVVRVEPLFFEEKMDRSVVEKAAQPFADFLKMRLELVG